MTWISVLLLGIQIVSLRLFLSGAGEFEPRRAWLLLLVSLVSWIGFLFFAFRRGGLSRLSFYKLFLILALGQQVWTMAEQLVGDAPGGWPGKPGILSDDIGRYLFDGGNTARGRNPYWYIPEQDAPENLRHQINHPGLATIYFPASQFLFALPAGLGRLSDLSGRLAWQFIILIPQVLALWLFRRKTRYQLLLALAWLSPLWQIEFGQVHQELFWFGLIPLVLAFLPFQVKPLNSGWVPVLAGMFTGLLAGVKPVAALVSIYLFGLARRHYSRRDYVNFLWVGVLPVVLLQAAAAVAYWLPDIARMNLRATVASFSSEFYFNNPLVALGQSMGLSAGQVSGFLRILWVGTIAGLVWAGWRRGGREFPVRGQWLSGSATLFGWIVLGWLLSSPVVHPWYFFWLMTVFLLRGRERIPGDDDEIKTNRFDKIKGLGWLALCQAPLASYLTALNYHASGAWTQDGWNWVAQAALLLLVVALFGRTTRARRRRGSPQGYLGGTQ